MNHQWDHRIDSAEVVQVIRVTHTAGHGTNESPIRLVTEWRTFDGTLIGRYDPSGSDESRTSDA